MKPFEEIFSKTEVFLNSKGVNPEIFRANRTTESLVKSFEKRFHLSLPENFSEFYLNFSDGYSFIWENGEEVGGGLIIPSLDQLAVNHQRWQKNVRDFLDDPRSLDGCVAPEFRASAFEVWTQMLSWLPIGCRDPEGDEFCLDTKSGRIVHNQHDWFDGFGELAKTNGIVAGENLTEYLSNWSRFSFCPPASLWWGEFGKFGIVKWEVDYFNEEFHRKA